MGFLGSVVIGGSDGSTYLVLHLPQAIRTDAMRCVIRRHRHDDRQCGAPATAIMLADHRRSATWTNRLH
ncbi:MAG: hypothetical protein B7X09_00775 [Acidiphilium sp. 21-66-27]|nr:MAG: hypothetical protein B7X09_00775 [Acidiphilium sp. 21-66-27]